MRSLFGKRAAPNLLEHGAVPWLLIAALATTLPHAEHLPPWLTALCIVALLARLGLWMRNARLPRRAVLIPIVVAGTAAIAWEFRTLLGREAGVALLCFFMALKPMEMHARRDGLVLVMLGFFLLLTHYLHAQTIPTGLWMLVCAVLLTATLIRLYGGTQPPRHLVRQAVLLIAQALPLMLIFFLLFPRIQGPLWGLPQDTRTGRTGLTDEMSPGSLNQLIQSGAIAFRAEFADLPPPRPQRYWRGPVLDDYDGKTWRATPLPVMRASGLAPRIEAHGPLTTYTLTLEAHDRRWLLALDHPITLPDNTALTPALEALARQPVRNRSRFAFRSAPDAVFNREETPAVLRRALRLPDRANPRARALADTWRQRDATPATISAAALSLFRNEAFFYTLQPPLLGDHAVDDFLFSSRRGFCEHYAGAYVFLMRAAGVPARVVTGYQGGETNPFDGTLTVRQSDAHAWAEIWIADRGWVRVDPTGAVAPSRVENGIAAALPEGDPLPALIRVDADWLRTLQGLRYRWEALNNAWNQWVLGYNPERQYEVLTRLGLRDPDWRTLVAAMSAATGITLLLLAAWTLTRRTRPAPEVRVWMAVCRQLERMGIPRAAWEGPFDLAERVAAQRPDLAPLVREAAGHFAALRYGQSGPERLTTLKHCARQLALQRRKEF